MVQRVIATYEGSRFYILAAYGAGALVLAAVLGQLAEGLGGFLAFVGVLLVIAGFVPIRRACPACTTKIAAKAAVCPQCHRNTGWRPAPQPAEVPA